MRAPPKAAAVVVTTVMPTWTVAKNRSGSARSAATVLAPTRVRIHQLLQPRPPQRNDGDLGAGKHAVDDDERQDDEELGQDHVHVPLRAKLKTAGTSPVGRG